MVICGLSFAGRECRTVSARVLKANPVQARNQPQRPGGKQSGKPSLGAISQPAPRVRPLAENRRGTSLSLSFRFGPGSLPRKISTL